jgi:hypothetical protein
MKKLLTFIALGMTGCASTTSNNSSDTELIARYVSPVHYLEYSCKQLRMTAQELDSVSGLFAKYMSSSEIKTIRYDYPNEISARDNHITPMGYAIFRGHQEAVAKAMSKNCK